MNERFIKAIELTTWQQISSSIWLDETDKLQYRHGPFTELGPNLEMDSLDRDVVADHSATTTTTVPICPSVTDALFFLFWLFDSKNISFRGKKIGRGNFPETVGKNKWLQ